MHVGCTQRSPMRPNNLATNRRQLRIFVNFPRNVTFMSGRCQKQSANRMCTNMKNSCGKITQSLVGHVNLVASRRCHKQQSSVLKPKSSFTWTYPGSPSRWRREVHPQFGSRASEAVKCSLQAKGKSQQEANKQHFVGEQLREGSPSLRWTRQFDATCGLF